MKSGVFYMLIAIMLVFTACGGGSSDGTTNEAPVAQAGLDQSVIVGDAVTFNGSSSSDDGSVEAYVWDENGTELSVDMSFTKSDFTVGTHTITLTVTDNQGATDSDEVVITVNAPGNLAPVADAQAVTTDENVALGITLSATDGDSDPLTYTVVALPTNGAISGTLPNLTYTPTAYYYGSDSFSFKVNDGTIDSATVIVSITVNDDPATVVHNEIAYGVVTSPYTGEVWLDRNLGASQVCAAHNDPACYGDYYQWGRNFDGHQESNSTTTTTQVADVNNAGTDFIIDLDWTAFDGNGALRATNWSKTDGSSVCPIEYRVPTITELEAETLDEGMSNGADAFSNFLKLPSAGYREYTDAAMNGEGSGGYIWSSSVNSSITYLIGFSVASSHMGDDYRAYGLSVRCIKY